MTKRCTVCGKPLPYPSRVRKYCGVLCRQQSWLWLKQKRAARAQDWTELYWSAKQRVSDVNP